LFFKQQSLWEWGFWFRRLCAKWAVDVQCIIYISFWADSWIKSAEDSKWSEEGRDPDDHFLGICWSFDCPPRGASGVCEGGGRVGSSRALGDSSDCPSPSDCPSLSDCHCLRDLNVRLDAFSLSGFSVRSCPFRHHSFCGQNGFLTSSVL